MSQILYQNRAMVESAGPEREALEARTIRKEPRTPSDKADPSHL
jgi:hypothetical protein